MNSSSEFSLKKDVTIFDKHTSQDFVEHQYGFFPPNVEAVKKAINSLHQAFPDFSMVIEDLVVSDDKVWGRMTARGTQKGFAAMEQLGMKSPPKFIMKLMSLAR